MQCQTTAAGDQTQECQGSVHQAAKLKAAVDFVGSHVGHVAGVPFADPLYRETEFYGDAEVLSSVNLALKVAADFIARELS